MDLAVVHYHLNRGGVTQVVINQLRALDHVLRAGARPMNVALLYGGRAEGWPRSLRSELSSIELHRLEVPGLDYDGEIGTSPADLAEAIGSGLEALGFARHATVVHAHNHALGKNVALPGAISRLAERGYRLLLQIHDFVEDSRPHLYGRLKKTLPRGRSVSFSGELYPQGRGVHYAFLNQRDLTIAEKAGFCAPRLHLLPNPVCAPKSIPSKEAARSELVAVAGLHHDEQLFVYPVRGIRRKNLTEMLLWSALAKEGTRFAATLKPLNPDETPGYDRTRALAAELGLPCVFEIGETKTFGFEQAMASADAVLTTSLAEGFGMVFLEAWLYARWLCGRNLPEITKDFTRSGLVLDGLSSRLHVPLRWVGRERFIESIESSYRSLLRSYGEAGEGGDLRSRIEEEMISNDTVDFGRMSLAMQEEIVRRARSSATAREELLVRNPDVARSLNCPSGDRDVIAANARAVLRSFGLEPSGRRLSGLYEQVLASEADEAPSMPLRGERLVKEFLSLERFRPLLAT